MNLPNKLTLLRIALVPVFVIFMMLPISFGNILALVVFVVAALTDTADGYIARKYDLVTDFGKFMDPLADKLLVCSALICFVDNGQLYGWYVIIIIAREFIISGFRLIAVEKGVVIAASWFGKIKTIVQMVMICALLINATETWFVVLEQILIWAALILTVLSLVDYIVKNRHILSGEQQ